MDGFSDLTGTVDAVQSAIEPNYNMKKFNIDYLLTKIFKFMILKFHIISLSEGKNIIWVMANAYLSGVAVGHVLLTRGPRRTCWRA